MAVVRSVRRWVVSHPLKSGVIWVLGLLFLVGGYFSIETALELPAQKAVQAQEAPAPWAKPHIERCLVEVKEDVSEAKAEEAVSCVALVIDITNLGHRPTAVLEDNPSAVLKAHLFYGGSQEWLSVLRLGDNRIAPVLRMCFEDGGSTLFDASSSFTNSVKAAIQGKAPSFEHLTPEKCGWYAVQLISKPELTS